MRTTDQTEMVRCPRCKGEGQIRGPGEDLRREIQDLFERSPDPFLWTSEVVEKVDGTRPTVLKHLDRMEELGVLNCKENVDKAWWLVSSKTNKEEA